VTTVLLTGAGGFAGHHCLQHVLATTDWKVICTDSFRHKGKTDRISQVLAGHPGWAARVVVMTHDLSVPFSHQMARAMDRIGPVDYVLAYASDSDVMKSITDPGPCVTNNVAVALNTLELCRVISPSALVWVSTDEVYGPVTDPEHGYPEWSTIIPSNPYAASKAAQEALCVAWWRTYDVPVMIVNCMNMIGERQQVQKYVPMIMRAVARGDTLTIHGSPDSIGSRHWLHARNLADAITFLLRHNRYETYRPLYNAPARYNLGSPDRIDNLALAQMIADTMGGDLRYRFEDANLTRPGHDKDYGLNPSKLLALGWKPPVPFAESLHRTVVWTQRHGEWLEDLRKYPPTGEIMGTERVISGPFGAAYELPVTDGPNCAATVCHYLINAPVFHPGWSQYNFHILRLTPNLPGLPEPHFQFKGATHEVGVVAIDPSEGHQTKETMIEFCTPDSPKFGKMPWLAPVNIACQVIAEDDELLRLAPHLMRSVVIKGVSPETSDAPDLVRRYWHAMIIQGIAHMRGEHESRVRAR
jgi:dTDP-glucose 4,6-dehydratase